MRKESQKMGMENHPKNQLLSLKSPWSQDANSIWIASLIEMRRNIEKFNFPGKLDTDRQKQIVSFVSKEYGVQDVAKNSIFLKGEECSPVEKDFLVEHFLTSESFQHAHLGEAFIVDRKGEFMVAINMKDHLQFYLLDTLGELETNWNKLVKMETKLGRSIAYSFSPTFGFLTSDPGVCGTGMRVKIFLQLTALIHTNALSEAIAKYLEESMVISGIQGNPSELIGDVVVLQNNYALGVNEENIISQLRTVTTRLLVEEKTKRAQIKHHESSELKDKVARAFGILMHSYQIEAIEALNEIALLKLGLEFGWLEGVTIMQLNELFFNCRRGHLLRSFSEKVSPEELRHKRAQFIHETLKYVLLTI